MACFKMRTPQTGSTRARGTSPGAHAISERSNRFKNAGR
jgi:hypothetical protein